MIRPPTQHAFDVVGLVVFVVGLVVGIIYGNWLLAIGLFMVSHYYMGHARGLR